jgi:hypothetical protein
MKVPSGFLDDVVAANHDSDGGNGDGGGMRTRPGIVSLSTGFATGTSQVDGGWVRGGMLCVEGML